MVGKVLIIDDNESDRFIHRKLLEHHRVSQDIVETSSGREALDLLEKVAGTGEEPALILLDLMMPGMNGFEFLQHYHRVKPTFKKAPLLFMVSSTEDDSDLRRSRENEHIIKLLHKPLLPATLIDQIKIHS